MCFSHVLERSESKNYHENLGTKFLLHGVIIANQLRDIQLSRTLLTWFQKELGKMLLSKSLQKCLLI